MLEIVFENYAENQISANPKMYYFDIVTADAIPESKVHEAPGGPHVGRMIPLSGIL